VEKLYTQHLSVHCMHSSDTVGQPGKVIEPVKVLFKQYVKIHLETFGNPVSGVQLAESVYSCSTKLHCTCLRCGGQCYMGFVANFITFLAVTQSFEDQLSFGQATAS